VVTLGEVFFIAAEAVQFDGEFIQGGIGLCDACGCFGIAEHCPQARLFEIFHVIKII
jgi:hypothetical protein